MRELILEYYQLISTLFNVLALPIRELADTMNLPLVSALLFGILGAAAPCQLSTNVAALVFLSRSARDGRNFWGQTLGFVTGKTMRSTLWGRRHVVGLSLSGSHPA
jgi:cytochrome c-type biogenesis protein